MQKQNKDPGTRVVECPACEGQGGWREPVLAGHVTKEMAMDAGSMDMEGMPLYWDEAFPCEACDGTGQILLVLEE